MVKTINVTLDDDTYDEIYSVKHELDVTWEEFLLLAAENLEPED